MTEKAYKEKEKQKIRGEQKREPKMCIINVWEYVAENIICSILDHWTVRFNYLEMSYETCQNAESKTRQLSLKTDVAELAYSHWDEDLEKIESNHQTLQKPK